MTGYIAYVDRITDAYSQQDIVVLMMESILNTNSSMSRVQSVLVSFCMVLPLVFREFLQKVLPGDLTLTVVHFQGKQLPSTLTRLLTSTCIFCFRICNLIML